MITHVHAPMGNEADRLPWFLDHYKFADRIFLYANHCADNSRKIARMANTPWLGVDVIEWDTPAYDDEALLELKNNCWKKESADWVIVCDIDEHVHGLDLPNMLRIFAGDPKFAILRPYKAWEMVTQQDIGWYTEATRGFFSPGHCKPCLFQPALVAEINYLPGCHYCNAVSKNAARIEPETLRSLSLRHYQCVGINRVLRRYRERAAIMSARNKEMGWGSQYLWSEMEARDYFNRPLEDVK